MEKKTDHWYTDIEKFQNESSKFPNHSQPKIYTLTTFYNKP